MSGRAKPDPETVLLETEDENLRPGQRRAHVLAFVEARAKGAVVPLTSTMLQEQRFEGISLVGIIATLDGKEGLFAQCVWFQEDIMDWFWAEIGPIKAIETRRDQRFRGGRVSRLPLPPLILTPLHSMLSVWVITEFAEYAVVTAHADYDDEWEDVLHHFGAPRFDQWPRCGEQPSWWPVQMSCEWPYDRSVLERYSEMLRSDSLSWATQNLSIRQEAPPVKWRRLGPKGDVLEQGRPATHLSQLSEWFLAPDAGMRKTVAGMTPKTSGGEAGPSRKKFRPARERSTATRG